MTIKTAVIGHPINHSKSPIIHNHWIRQHGLDATYEALDISCENLEQGVRKLVEEGYSGFNVTLPHKIAIMDFCDEIDETATVIGAVNTVTIKDGKLYGTNTDAFGFIQNIKQNAPEFEFKGGKAVIIGAGGAARAILYALLHEDVPGVTVTNRTPAKAQALAVHSPYNIKILRWNEREDAIRDANLIINTTSLGMSGQDPLDIDPSYAPASALVTDIVYTPLITDFLARAQKREMPVVTGIGMLLHQARPGFELWHGILPDVTPALEESVL